MPDNKFLSLAILIVFSVTPFVGVFAQTQPVEDDEVIKVDTALVNIPFSVSDRQGRAITGLTKDNFALLDDGKPQKIEYLSTQDAPVSLVLLIDTSPSTQEIFDKIKYAANEFLKQLRPTDRCMIISFDQAAKVKSEFTNDQKALNNALRRTVLAARGGTVLYDTLFVTIDKELAKVTGRKAVILITDGRDKGSSITQRNLFDRLVESDAPIYSVMYQREKVPEPQLPSDKTLKKNQSYRIDQSKFKEFTREQSRKNAEAAKFLQQISEITGGRTYQKQIDGLAETFGRIAEDLRMQYLIGFYPDEADYDIAKHQIKVRVDRANVVVRLKNNTLLRPDK